MPISALFVLRKNTGDKALTSFVQEIENIFESLLISIPRVGHTCIAHPGVGEDSVDFGMGVHWSDFQKVDSVLLIHGQYQVERIEIIRTNFSGLLGADIDSCFQCDVD